MNSFDERIDTIERNASAAGITLPPGASEEAIAAAEAALGVVLPPEVRAFYLRHDGGGEDAFHLDADRELLSLEGIVGQWRIWKNLLDEDAFDDERARPGSGVQARWFTEKWIPLTFDAAGSHHMLDLDPAPGGTHGQVLSFWHDSPERTCEGPDFLTWLAGCPWGEGVEREGSDEVGRAGDDDDADDAPEPTFDAEHVVFSKHAGAGDVLPRAQLAIVMSELGQAQLVAQANEVIDFVKRYMFDPAPDDVVSWAEMKAWLKSDKPG